MRKTVSDEFVSGYMEKAGGFYLYRGSGKKKYLGFKIVSKGDNKLTMKVIDFLSDALGIEFSTYMLNEDIVYYIANKKNVSVLKKWMMMNCFRRDFKKFTHTQSHGWKKIENR